jgi:HAD superfamily hydrolase (TIGR01509 family)
MSYRLYKNGKQPAKICGVLFDMDGVVLDTETLYARFWREAAAALGHTMSYEQALGMRSLSNTAGQTQLERYFGKGVSRAEFRTKRIELMDAYVDVHGVDLKPGIRELLDFLDEKGIKAAITTSSPLERVERYLGPHGLLHRFQRLCSGAEVAHGKPEPDIYLFGAACLGLQPEVCIAIEDSPAGVLSAYRAGCMTVMVPDLDQPDEETEKLLYAKADSLTDVIALVKNIEK